MKLHCHRQAKRVWCNLFQRSNDRETIMAKENPFAAKAGAKTASKGVPAKGAATKKDACCPSCGGKKKPC